MSWKDNQIMLWNGNAVTDHNRSALDINRERIEKKNRMVNGRLRKYYIIGKRTFSCNWDLLPSNTEDVAVGGKVFSGTVDGAWGGKDMEAFHDATPGAFTLTVVDGQGNEEQVLVMFSDFNYSIEKRGRGVDFWNLSVTLEEV